MRIGILTSDDIRHRHFVNALRAELHVAAVCYQDTRYHPAAAAAQKIGASHGGPCATAPTLAGKPPVAPPDAARTAAIVKHHFDERTWQEQRFFGQGAALVSDSAACRVFAATPPTLNSADTVARLRDAGVDAVVVYGTSLIKPPLIDAFPGRMINMHLGLSPYYRGTATNFYPLLNDEPEYVGVTIHHIDAGIDSGAIIHQGRPEITADDMPHTAGCKAIQVGIALMIRTMRELESGSLQSVPQWPVPIPRLYLRKDYHPSQVVRLYEVIEDGLFPRYAARKTEVAPRVRLVP